VDAARQANEKRRRRERDQVQSLLSILLRDAAAVNAVRL